MAHGIANLAIGIELVAVETGDKGGDVGLHGVASKLCDGGKSNRKRREDAMCCFGVEVWEGRGTREWYCANIQSMPCHILLLS